MSHHREPFTPRSSVNAMPLRNRDLPPSAREVVKKERMLEVTIVGANYLTESPLSTSEKGYGPAARAEAKKLYATVSVGRIRKKTGDSKVASDPVWNSKILLDVDASFDAEGHPASNVPEPTTDAFCTIQIWRHVPIHGDENGEEISIGKLLLSRQDISPLARDRSLAWYPLIVKTEVEGCCSLESCMKPKVMPGEKVPQVRLGFRWAWRDNSRQRQPVSTTPIHITSQPLGPSFGSLKPPSQRKEIDRGRETYTRIPNTQTPDFVAEHEEVHYQPTTSARALRFDTIEEVSVGNRNARQKMKVEDDPDWFEELFTQIGESLGFSNSEPAKSNTNNQHFSAASNSNNANHKPSVYFDFVSRNMDQCLTCTARPRMEESMAVVVERRVGVGLNLISNDRGDLVVAGIQKAGPAGCSGKLQLGDVLLAVDGQEVSELMPERGIERSAGMDWDSVLLGEEGSCGLGGAGLEPARVGADAGSGSTVELTLKRYDVANLTSAEANGSHSIHRVLLQRRRHELPNASNPRPSSVSLAHQSARSGALSSRRMDSQEAHLL